MVVKKTLMILVLLAAGNCAPPGEKQPAPSNGARNPTRPRPSAAPTPSSHFDQQRLVDLFGSEAQPVYGNRDPNTGRVIMLETGPFSSDPASPTITNKSNKPAGIPTTAPRHYDESGEEVEEEETEQDAAVAEEDESEPIDRKDTRVPETNEINPFELLPPQFHDLLNIPIHDYGNGTTYNPYDKFKVPSKNKYPLVSTGYANTKVQGTPSSTSTVKPAKPYGYNYDDTDEYPLKSTKPVRRPASKPKTNPTTESYQTPETTTKKYRPRPTFPSTKRPDVRPQSSYRQPEISDYDDEEEGDSQQPKHIPQNEDRNPLPSKAQYPYEDAKPQRPEQVRPFQQQKDQYETRPYGRPQDHRVTTPTYNDDDRPFRPLPYNRPHQQEDSSFKPPMRPSYEEPAQRPTTQRPSFSLVGESHDDDDRQQPLYIAHSYKDGTGANVAEIKVTPKPFYAADDSQTFHQQPGQVDDAPDIIYDYDDERGKGEGVLFLVDKGIGTSGGSDSSSGFSGSNKKAPPVTASPVASPYPTVASRDRLNHNGNPPFRPSAPVRQGIESTLFAPRPDFSAPSSFPQQQQPSNGFNPPPPQQSGFNSDVSRPALRFPNEQPSDENPQKQQQPPNILPLFRPNTNPTDEFQFIKHPQQVGDFQRQQLQPHQGQFRPHHDAPPQRRPTSMSPLPSALQSPFSSISQAVANFFGRRSGSSASGTSRSGDLLATDVKTDRTGVAVGESDEDVKDLEMAESRAFNFFSRLDRPFIIQPPPAAAIRRTDNIATIDPAQQVVGIRADPKSEDKNPPAFYVYTERELEQGKPPYLVVGPVMSGPPNVAGAQLVHTAPAQPIQSAESQRRSDGPVDGGRPVSFNALQFPSHLSTSDAPVPNQEVPVAPPRKPFFPGSKINRPLSGLAPPRQQGVHHPHRRPPPTVGFSFPDDPDQELTGPAIPKGIAPIAPGIAPPRVPLNPQKDVASLFSNPTLLHTPPEDGFESGKPLVTEHGLPVRKPFVEDGAPTFGTVSSAPLNNIPSPSSSSVTVRPPKRKSPTKPPTTTTTPAYAQSFNYQEPVTYSTIQQEDGKQIAVVHPAYIVTYKNRPGPPSLESLDAPFIPSIETPLEEGEMSSIPFEKWHAMHHEDDRATAGSQDTLPQASNQHQQTAGSGISPSLHGGFVPFDPNVQH